MKKGKQTATPKKRIKRDYTSRYPQSIDENVWYYEERRGIRVTAYILNDVGALLKTANIFIPWKILDASHRRHIQTEKAYALKSPKPPSSIRRAGK